MGEETRDSGAVAGAVRCACGTSVSVPADTVGREQTCPSCAAVFKVVWAVDQKTREKVLTRVAATGGAIRIPAGSHQLICACGQVLVARKDQAGRKVKCPVCGAAIVVETFKDPQTLQTRVRRAGEKSAEQPGQKAEGTAIIAAKPLGRTTRRRKAPSGAQDILCSCGENLRVFAEHLDKKVMCPECGTLMKMDKSKDSQTSATTVRPRIVGKSEPPPKTDPDQWSLNDFS
jgi:DNA-directed RNA polymerase subunit M/transcription elongation factor TFIIS